MSNYFIQTVGKGKNTLVKLQRDEGTRVNVCVMEYTNKKFYLIFPYFVSKIDFEKWYKPITLEQYKNLYNKLHRKKIHYYI